MTSKVEFLFPEESTTENNDNGNTLKKDKNTRRAYITTMDRDSFILATDISNKYRKNVVAVWGMLNYIKGIKRSDTFLVTHQYLLMFHIKRTKLKEKLELLQEAGLITFEVSTGKSPQVTILPVDLQAC